MSDVRMTLEQWTTTVTRELEAAGFTVEHYHGFPLVKRPEEWEVGIRLIKWTGTVAVDKRIYAEGMLFVPAGLPR